MTDLVGRGKKNPHNQQKDLSFYAPVNTSHLLSLISSSLLPSSLPSGYTPLINVPPFLGLHAHTHSKRMITHTNNFLPILSSSIHTHALTHASECTWKYLRLHRGASSISLTGTHSTSLPLLMRGFEPNQP